MLTSHPTELRKRTRVKFCGLTREDDVAAACALGVDAVGFVCDPASARFVPPDRLAALARQVAPFTTPVLLFVDADPAVIRAALARVPDALLQFHGHEPVAACVALQRPYVRAVALGDGVDLLDCEIQFSSARALLADAPTGGSGRVFDWSRVPPASRRRLPLILAGGLNPGNVGAAIAAVRPAAVDVSSGIENGTRGIKSEKLMKDFVDAVQVADRVADRSADGEPA